MKRLSQAAVHSAAARRAGLVGAFRASLLAAIAAIAFFTHGASAQPAPAFTLPAPPFELPLVPSVSGYWTATVGAGAEYKPDFEGSKRSMLSPVPIFAIRRAGSAEQFHSPFDGASIALLDFGDLRAGPAAKFKAARNANDFPELAGFGNVNATLEIGGFVEYFPVDWLRTRIETRQGLWWPQRRRCRLLGGLHRAGVSAIDALGRPALYL